MITKHDLELVDFLEERLSKRFATKVDILNIIEKRMDKKPRLYAASENHKNWTTLKKKFKKDLQRFRNGESLSQSTKKWQ